MDSLEEEKGMPEHREADLGNMLKRSVDSLTGESNDNEQHEETNEISIWETYKNPSDEEVASSEKRTAYETLTQEKLEETLIGVFGNASTTTSNPLSSLSSNTVSNPGLFNNIGSGNVSVFNSSNLNQADLQRMEYERELEMRRRFENAKRQVENQMVFYGGPDSQAMMQKAFRDEALRQSGNAMHINYEQEFLRKKALSKNGSEDK